MMLYVLFCYSNFSIEVIDIPNMKNVAYGYVELIRHHLHVLILSKSLLVGSSAIYCTNLHFPLNPEGVRKSTSLSSKTRYSTTLLACQVSNTHAIS